MTGRGRERGENVRGLVGLLEFGKHVGMVEMRRVAGQGVVGGRRGSGAREVGVARVTVSVESAVAPATRQRRRNGACASPRGSQANGSTP